MEYTKKFIYQSNYWYNDGLRKAQIRDISGAVTSLRKSLSYNGGNIDARNLLGLVYYGRGEVSEALVEWILSKNIMPESNIASYFIKKIQSTPGELDKVNGAVKRYNQSLTLLKQKSDDLAIIQLKKAIAEHPSFLKAYQLLSLVYINKGQYRLAKPLLKKARKLDTTNDITLSYIHEVSRITGKKAKEEEARVIDETTRIDISEMVSEKANRPQRSQSGGKYGLKHLVISAVVGALLVAFLAIPAVFAGRKQDDAEKILEYSERINAMEAQISAQSKALEDYRKSSLDEEGNAKNAVVIKETYENLIYARALFEEGNHTSDAVSEMILKINPDVLGTSGRELYDSFVKGTYKSASASLFESGELAYENEKYKKAVKYFRQVVDMGETYRDGEALLYLGNSFYKLEDYTSAEQCLNYLIKILPESKNAGFAKNTLDKISDIKKENR